MQDVKFSSKESRTSEVHMQSAGYSFLTYSPGNSVKQNPPYAFDKTLPLIPHNLPPTLSLWHG